MKHLKSFLWIGIFLVLSTSMYAIPSISSVSILGSSGRTYEALNTDNITATQIGINNTINITDWRVNGTSIAILNMPFEGGSTSTTTKDHSTYSNNISVITKGSSTPVWNATGGYDGHGAYMFDGKNATIMTSANTNVRIANLSPITVTAWVLPVSTTSAVVVAKQAGASGGWAVMAGSSESIRNVSIMYKDSTNNQQTYWGRIPLPINTWSHIAVLLNTSNSSRPLAKIWVNGVKDTVRTDVYKNYWDGANDNITIGSRMTSVGMGFSSFFNGSIDEVKIYNRVLSPEEILLIYNNRSDIMSEKETLAGENWSACITPNDGIQDGSSVCSNTINIVSSLSTEYLSTLTIGNQNPRYKIVIKEQPSNVTIGKYE